MSSYDQYSTTYLTELYYVIKKNIETGFLSSAMRQELALIAEAVNKQGVMILENKRVLQTYHQACNQK
ncbi:hypothetical protein NIE88_08650 [Sporolactobacillus shoreicorticis]|uniref:Uncharacterized protein n=1 Tax=Sporolactobacillus shoreicorticis TaxID=1923877 RepID=A0ABW5S2X2_9BACL|nr:hypothetical protein [Sporolactobacillus shoreicorticis]MCO7125839.1 hypothetical protein [Sporolactobacillus shoreicorticis]